MLLLREIFKGMTKKSLCFFGVIAVTASISCSKSSGSDGDSDVQNISAEQKAPSPARGPYPQGRPCDFSSNPEAWYYPECQAAAGRVRQQTYFPAKTSAPGPSTAGQAWQNAATNAGGAQRPSPTASASYQDPCPPQIGPYGGVCDQNANNGPR
jgi:hypothetical protein